MSGFFKWLPLVDEFRTLNWAKIKEEFILIGPLNL